MQSADLTQENIAKLRELFPMAVTESSESGRTRLAVSLEVLAPLLGLSFEESSASRERYEFSWPGKGAALRQALKPSGGTLRPCPEESWDWEHTQNLYLKGDNLEILKLLRRSYAGRVRLIYIDPPYNTGHDFIYNDNYAMSRQAYRDYQELCGAVTGGLRNYSCNSGAAPRFHSDWCSMIYARLILARELLTPDGVIFISIGEAECANLRKICDEVLGEGNLIAQFIWEKTQHFGRQRLNCYQNADYLLCYGKALRAQSAGLGLRELLVEQVKTELEDAPLYNASNPVKTLTFPPHTVSIRLPDGLYVHSTSPDYVLRQPVQVVQGRNSNALSLSFKSRWSNAHLQQEIANGTTFLVKRPTFAIRALYGQGKASKSAPRQLLFSNKNNPACTKSRWGQGVGTTENATKQLGELMESESFSYPKPVALIKYLCSLLWDEAGGRHARDFLVLDFFSGSATTAQAVMELNLQDAGQRRFILVQLEEPCPKDSPAYRAGYQDICQIGIERLRRVALACRSRLGLQAKANSLDLGLRVLQLDSSNMSQDNFQTLPLSANPQESLKAGLSYLKNDRSELDLLFGYLLQNGWSLDQAIDCEELAQTDQAKLYVVGGGKLLACFAPSLPLSAISQIAQRRPSHVLLLDSCFTESSDKINAIEIFKTLSEHTVLDIL